MIKSYFFVLFIFSPSFLFAQDSIRSINKLSIEGGLNFLSRQDQLFSPMVYNDITPQSASLFYSNENSRRIHTAEVNYSGYKASWHDEYIYLTGIKELKEQSTSPTFITMVALRYSFLKKIKTDKMGSWSVGGISDNQINAVDNVYGAFGTFGYLGQFSLSPMVKRDLDIDDKSSLAFSAYFPLVSWISRSPYALNDDEYMQNNADHNGFKTFFRYVGDGNLQTVNRFQKLNLNAEYLYRLSPHWQLGGAYRFEFLRSSLPKPLIAYRNDLHVKISYQF